ncbi:MAG: hypothetical protein NUV77_12955 [Thermoguttaceae bacterium]|jgi:hypothetical protein|nr:hypothetical protein [Thermoguttaceae bacterium]
MPRAVPLFVAGLFALAGAAADRIAGAEPATVAPWRARLVALMGHGPKQALDRAMAEFPRDRLALAVVADWMAQDRLDAGDRVRIEAIADVIGALGPAGGPLRARYDELARGAVPAHDPRWADLYLAAAHQRRRARLAPHLEKLRRVVFTKHYDLGGSHYAYTEGQSDAQNERHFVPGSALCLLEVEGGEVRVRTLLEDRHGVIRDPDVSYDGRRIVFAWKKSLDGDDYHLYEMTVDEGTIRQITSGLGFADYEPAFLPNGDLVFNSTRCVQTVDCWWTEVSNLYTCDARGRYLRQLGFDQVHTNYPTVTPDGRVIYTRWDYNDRGQIYPQGLFQMNPDGTGQSAVYGNNSWFPTTVLHARAIPNTGKIVCIFTGHHSIQKGWLGILDPSRGREENQGAQLIAPVRETPAERIDAYGQSGDQFQYPYPLDEEHFLVGFKTEESPHFGIYWMAIDGQRELLACDSGISCNQPVPLAARPCPPQRPHLVDYRKDTGTVYLHDIYRGPGLEGVPRGRVRRLRVVALEFRAAGIGSNENHGPAGGALASTPISIQGAWDVKKVLGTAAVHADGSACFTVPARTPLYFQALDEQDRMIQSMRSWVSLQPGETASCVGCHEHKNAAPPVTGLSLALRSGPQELAPFYGPARGFSFIREIQPILDRHCVRCHYEDRAWDGTPAQAGGAVASDRDVVPAFSLKGDQTLDPEAQRKWSDAYKALADRRLAQWIDIQSAPPMLPPYHAGASQSRLVAMLERGEHYGIRLSKPELDRFIVWIDLLVPYVGDYTEAMNEEHVPRYRHFLDKRRRWQAEEERNLAEFVTDRKPR